MPLKNDTLVSEDIIPADTSNDANGKGSQVPSPVDTGDAHANRGADKTDETDAAIADVRGTDVSRASMIVAIIQQLVGLDGTDLSQIYTSTSLTQDVTAPGAAAAPIGANQSGNLASIATKEEIEDLFAGHDLSEEFKEKALTLFNAALFARLTGEKEVIKEEAQAQIDETVNSVTDKLVGEIDRYMTFAAESVMTETKANLETVTRNEKAEGFITTVMGLAEQYKIDSDAEVSSKVAELEAQLAEAATKLNEAIEREVTLNEDLKAFRKSEVFNEVSGSLTAIQRGKFKTLSEGIEYDTPENYRTRLNVIKESVVEAAKRTTTPPTPALDIVSESVDGVPAITDDVHVKTVSKDPLMAGVIGVLSRQK